MVKLALCEPGKHYEWMQATELNFPYRPLLEELTVVARERGLDPYEAYGWLHDKQQAQELAPQTYCSTSITSGGHARDESLGIGDIIRRNTASALLLAEQLAVDDQLNPAATIEPVSVGKTGWNQAQYMEFWFSVIGGYELTNGFHARDIDNLRRDTAAAGERIDLDVDLMVSSAAASDRAAEYFKMSQAFASLITAGRPARPIATLIRMVDTELSLGAQTERAFARQIGARVMNISVVKPAHPIDLQSVNHILSDDVARLITFGATVFDTSNNRTRLMLQEAVA